MSNSNNIPASSSTTTFATHVTAVSTTWANFWLMRPLGCDIISHAIFHIANFNFVLFMGLQCRPLLTISYVETLLKKKKKGLKRSHFCTILDSAASATPFANRKYVEIKDSFTCYNCVNGIKIRTVKVGKRGVKRKLHRQSNDSTAATSRDCGNSVTNTDFGNSGSSEDSGRIQETASPSTMERAVELLKGYYYKQAFKLLAKSSVSAHKAVMDIAKKTIEEEVMSAYCKLKDGQINY